MSPVAIIWLQEPNSCSWWKQHWKCEVRLSLSLSLNTRWKNLEAGVSAYWVYPVDSVYKIKSILSFIFHAIYGAVSRGCMYSTYPFLLWWLWEYRVTHICVSKQANISSDNGLSPGRRQAIIWTNAGILLIGPLGTNFSEMLIEIYRVSLKKCIWKYHLYNGGHFERLGLWPNRYLNFSLIKSEVWPICLGLGHQTVVCAIYPSMFCVLFIVICRHNSKITFVNLSKLELS